CEVCKEILETSSFPTRKTTTRCQHGPHTCKDCMQKWISECVENKGWAKCVCPECGEGMGWEDVRSFSSVEGFKRYATLALRDTLSKIEGFHWCMNPNGCPSGQIQPPDNAVFTCVSCAHVYCVNHPTTPYHAGETCSQFEARISVSSSTSQSPTLLRRTEEKVGERTVREIGKRCPNSICGYWIEKVEGCDHM
ncbi:uncharacterized protein BDR25DRAFT_193969, partial [Lindgomyces ingoldianus]